MSGPAHPLVFVSHAAEDKAIADAVCAAIESVGVRCWIAPRDIITGANWAKSILDGIAGAKLMVLIFSHHTSKSPHVRREIERAVHRDVAIAPLRVEDVMPEGDLEYFLSSQHWSDLFPGPVEQRIREVPQKVCTLLGVTPQEPKAPPPLPRKPEPAPVVKKEEPEPPVQERAPIPPAQKPPPISVPQPAAATLRPAPSYPQVAPAPPQPAPGWQQPAPSRKLLPWVMGAMIGVVAIILLMVGLVAADKAGWFETSDNKNASADSTAPPPAAAPVAPIAPGAPTVTPSQVTTPPPSANSFAAVYRPRQMANSIFMKFVLIKPDSFTMGDNDGFADEKPAHRVTITKPFYLQECEVTQGHWMSVMGTTPQQQRDPVNSSMYLPGEGDNLPMCFVSWDDAQRFCQKLSSMDGHRYRLPTEAEWEFACRAGMAGQYCFGDSVDVLDDFGWSTNNAQNAFHPVEQKSPNLWGLYDMHGNVWEWCQDSYGPYTGASQTDPTGPATGAKHVLRGGAWANKPANCRSAIRLARPANIIANDAGFRVVMEIQ